MRNTYLVDGFLPLYWNPGVTYCREATPFDFVSVLEVPVDDDTASENSLLYPTVKAAVGPEYIHPTVASNVTPSLFV
jgi:hypothetical protein